MPEHTPKESLEFRRPDLLARADQAIRQAESEIQYARRLREFVRAIRSAVVTSKKRPHPRADVPGSVEIRLPHKPASIVGSPAWAEWQKPFIARTQKPL